MLTDYPGHKLKALRKRAHLTQEQVNELTGISIATLCYLERGKRSPQTATLEKLLNLYAIRIRKFEHLEQTWAMAPQAAVGRPLSPAGVVEGNGADKVQGLSLSKGVGTPIGDARREFSNNAHGDGQGQGGRLRQSWKK